MNAQDVSVESHGSIFLFRPTTPEGQRWIAEWTDAVPSMWFGGSLPVEHRYARELAQAMLQDGLDLTLDGHRISLAVPAACEEGLR